MEAAHCLLVKLSRDSPHYPEGVRHFLQNCVPVTISALGNLEILRARLMALFCSVKCPGKLILETYDLAHKLREEGVTVISGFHSPMERECLEILLRGTAPVVLCRCRGGPRARPRALAVSLTVWVPDEPKGTGPTMQVRAIHWRRHAFSGMSGRDSASFPAKPHSWSRPYAGPANPGRADIPLGAGQKAADSSAKITVCTP